MKQFFIPGVSLACLTLMSWTFFTVRPEPYFTRGNTLSYTITQENGATSYSDVLVKRIETWNGQTVIYAHDNRLNDQRKSTFSYSLHFYNDTTNWCVDALNHLNCPLVYSSTGVVLQGDSLVYPYRMKMGDTLPPAAASELIRGVSVNERRVKFINRKVTATESVTIGGTAMQSFRIECKMISTSITDYGSLGKIPTETIYEFTEWFVPSKGVVKSVSKSGSGEKMTVLQ